MDQNPFQPPQTLSTQVPPRNPVVDAQVIQDIQVDGKYLVVRSGAQLPPFCVRSNEPINRSSMRLSRLTWVSPLFLVLLLVSRLLAIILYFVIRKTCVLRWGMSHEVAKQFRGRFMIKIMVSLLLFFTLPFAIETESGPMVFTMLALTFISTVTIFLWNSPVRITKYHAGEFWISGCSSEFLARLAKNPLAIRPSSRVKTPDMIEKAVHELATSYLDIEPDEFEASLERDLNVPPVEVIGFLEELNLESGVNVSIDDRKRIKSVNDISRLAISRLSEPAV